MAKLLFYLLTASLQCTCILVISAALPAQVSRVSGQLAGNIRDSAGAYIPGAEIVSVNTSTNQRWTTLSDDAGHFRFGNLPDGSYSVRVHKSGFADLTSNPFSIALGTVVQVELQLQPASAQQITVNADSSILEAEQTSPAAVIDKERIEESPVQSRNYLNFIVLAPGVTPSNQSALSGSLSLRDSGFSFGGLRPRSNALYIDGANNNDEFTGGNRTEISLEDVQEFQVVNHGFTAELGGSAGGSIDVVTRAGSNTIHGDAFVFVQNGVTDAKPPLEATLRKPDLNRERIGLSIGGPFRRDKSFYYTTFEQEHARGEEATDLAPTTVAALNAALSHNGRQVTNRFFPTGREETEFSQRFDQQLGATTTLMLRYAFNNNREVNEAFNTSDIVDFSGRGSSFTLDHELIGGLTTALSSRSVNELHLQLSTRRATQRTVDLTGPGIEVPGIVQLGRPYSANGQRHENHVEVNETYSMQRGAHLFKAGVWIDNIHERAAVGNGFGGVFIFPSLDALALKTPDFYEQAFGNPRTNFTATRYAGFAQDHWVLSPNFTVDYGLRYDFNQLPSAFHQNTTNVSPRLGIAYRPWGDWLLRAGFGMFYDRYPLAAINEVLEKSGVRAFDQVLVGAAAATAYQAGPQALPFVGTKPSIIIARPKLANAYSEVANVGLEHAIAKDLSLGVSYSFVRGVKLLRTANVNLALPIPLTTTNAAALGVAMPIPQQLDRFIFPPTRLNPAYDRVNQLQSAAGSTYHGLTLTANRRLAQEFELLASYTYAKAIDDASDFVEHPQNPYAPRAERAPSLQDQRHRFVMSALWDLPIGDEESGQTVTHPNAVTPIFSNIQVAPIFSVGSGQPTNPLVGTDASLSHVYPFNDRPLGFARNSLRAPTTLNLDLRVLKAVKIGRGKLDIVAESFNVFNHLNVVQLNPYFGPSAIPNSGFAKPIQAQVPRQVQFSLDYEF